MDTVEKNTLNKFCNGRSFYMFDAIKINLLFSLEAPLHWYK